MNLRTTRALFLGTFAAMLGSEAAAQAILPKTEQGDVLLRPLDYINIPGTPTIAGHVSIFEGWQGDTDATNPDNYLVVDTQCQPGVSCTAELLANAGLAPDSIIQERTFTKFTTFNTLVVVQTTGFDGGFTLSQSVGGVPVNFRRK